MASGTVRCTPARPDPAGQGLLSRCAQPQTGSPAVLMPQCAAASRQTSAPHWPCSCPHRQPSHPAPGVCTNLSTSAWPTLCKRSASLIQGVKGALCSKPDLNMSRGRGRFVQG